MYQKQNFLDGDILKAIHLNNIENCVDNLKDIQKIPKSNIDFEDKNLESIHYIKNKPFEVYFDDTIYDCTQLDSEDMEGLYHVKNSNLWINDFSESKENAKFTWTDGTNVYNDFLVELDEEKLNHLMNGEIASGLYFLDYQLLIGGSIPKNMLGILLAVSPEVGMNEIGILLSKTASMLGMPALAGLYVGMVSDEFPIQLSNIQLNTYRVNYNIKYTGFFESFYDIDLLLYSTQNDLETLGAPVGSLILLDNEQQEEIQ